MPNNVIEIVIAARDAASSVVNSALGKMNSATQAYNNTLSKFNGNVQSSVGQMAGLAAQVLSVRAAFQTFQAGIQAVDDFRLATIGVASTLTDMAQAGSGDLKQVYADNLQYAQDTYQKVELAAAKYFASGKEMIEAWKILAQKGVVVFGQKDIDALGVITDKIKLATAGQASSIQIAQELRAVMDGQARATSQIAMMLKDRLGPEWEKQLEKARQEGKILEFLAGQFSGLAYASKDVTNTLEAQKSTLSTLLSQVARGGLSGAYEDITRWISQANDYLETHRFIIADKISRAWISVRGVIEGVGSAIKGLNDTLSNSTAGSFAVTVAGWGTAFLLVMASFRKFVDVIKWGFGLFAANLAWITTLLSGFLAPFTAIVAAAAGVSSALGTVVAGLLLIGAALVTKELWDYVKNWEIAGNKISEYVEMGQLYMGNFGRFLKNFFINDFPGYVRKGIESALAAFENFVMGVASKLNRLANINEFDFYGGGETEGPSLEPEAKTEWSDTTKDLMNRARLDYLKRLGKARQAGKEAPAGLAEYEGSLEAEGADLKSPLYKVIKRPKVTTPPPEPDKDKAAGVASAVKKQAEEEIRLAEAMGKAKVRWIEEAMDASKRAFEDGKVSAAEYYAYASALAGAKYQEQINTIEAEKSAISKAIETEQAQAKSAQEKSAIAVKFEVKRVELEGELAKVRNDFDKTMQDLDDSQKKHAKERLDAEASVLRTILDQEVITDADRKIVGDEYLAVRTEQIRLEAEEWRKKGVEAVRIEQWAAAEIKKVQQELTRFNLAELQNMLNDVATTAADKERIWREINNRIASGEVDTWTAFKLGMQNTGTHFNNMAQDMLENGKQIATGLRDGFQTLFLSALKNDFSTFKDWFRSFVDALLAQWTQTLANMLTKWIMNTEVMKSIGSGLSSLFGLSGMGGGATAATAETVPAFGTVASGYFSSLLPKAEGGPVSKGTPYLVGERGPEIFVPDNGGTIIPNAPSNRITNISTALHSIVSGFAKGGTTTFISPFIPAFASGGIVSSPSLSLVGEGKHREAIVPLPDGRSIPAIITDQGSKQQAAANNLTTHITVNVTAPAGSNGQVDPASAQKMGEIISEAIDVRFNEKLRENMRPGGLLNRGRSY